MAYSEVTPSTPEPLPQEQQRIIKSPSDKWTDMYALSVVRSDWAHAESFRVNAHDWRYRNADELYLAWAGQRFWDGTRVPRSSLGQYVVFEQVEAMLPKVMSAVSNPDSYHFSSVQPSAKDNELIELAWRELVLAQLDEINFREQVRRAVKSMEIYGNGILEAGVEEYEEEYVNFDKQTRVTQTSLLNHPVMGPMMVPSATEDRFKRKISSEKKLRPYVRYVSVKDFYVDPNCESTSLQEAGYVIKRIYMRAEQLKELREAKDFNVPDDMTLSQISMAKATSNQDVTKLGAELFRYNMWNPAQDYTSDPSQKRIPIVEYTKKNRKIWWIQGTDHIIYNQPNPYGMINYFSVPYADVLDRWAGLSVSDVAEGEQRVQQAVINARLDELALALHPPMVKRRGVTVPAYQLKRRPGVVIEVENPKEDVVQGEVLNVTQQAFGEVEASERRVQRITGMSDLAALGAPTSGGNSASRTATGVNTQVGATQDRVKYIIENIESNLIEPVVNAVIKFDRKFMDTKQAANWLKLDPRFQKLDPIAVMNTRVSAECRGSIKMAARTGFLQIFPMLAQSMFNPEFLQLLAQQQQKTINVEETFHMVMDAINYAPRNPLIVEMSKQQIQAMQQPPAEAQIQAMMQQSKQQSDEEINDKRLMAKIFETMVKMGFTNHAKMAELDDKHDLGTKQIAQQDRAAERQADAARAGANKAKGK